MVTTANIGGSNPQDLGSNPSAPVKEQKSLEIFTGNSTCTKSRFEFVSIA